MEAILSIASELKIWDIHQEYDRWIIKVELMGNEQRRQIGEIIKRNYLH
jgi:hypothetical protein